MAMDTLQRAQASRHGGCSFVTKFLTRAQAITKADEQVTLLSISEADRETIDLVLSQLLAKKTQLEELDQTFATAITVKQDLEDETADVEMYHFNLTERITILQKYFSASAAKSKSQPSGPSTQM